MIAHVDADCFFASVELRGRPELKNREVLVCSRTDNRGIVLAATYPARKYGIRAGTPLFKVRTLCPQALLITSHFSKYAEVSRALMQLLHRISPDVVTVSVDEAYVDLTGLRLLYKKHFPALGAYIQQEVEKSLGITISVGIAPTKLLAKIASDYKKPAGLTIIRADKIDEFLQGIPLESIPGVGRKNSVRLRTLGLSTAYDVAYYPMIRSIFGSGGALFQYELRGKRLYKRIVSDKSAQKSMSHTRTFPYFSSDRTYIHHFSVQLAKEISHKLQCSRLTATQLTFFLVTKEFSFQETTHKLDRGHADAFFLTMLISHLFSDLFIPGKVYRKAGIVISQLQTDANRQLRLFSI